jgi:hypothetical protein
MWSMDAEPEPNNAIMDQDIFLEFLITIISRADLGLSITLNVGGALISGTLIEGPAYFKGIGEEVRQVAGDIPKTLARGIEQFGAMIYGYTNSSKGSDEDYTPTPRIEYIHLANARFFSPSGESLPSNRGVFWRGRLSSVDGFCLGALSHTEETA